MTTRILEHIFMKFQNRNNKMNTFTNTRMVEKSLLIMLTAVTV